MRKVNAAKLAKRRKRKPRLRASVRKAVLERDGNQCTATVNLPTLFSGEPFRCRATESLHVHEKRYPAEIDDAITLCRYHHELLESQIRPWNRGRIRRS